MEPDDFLDGCGVLLGGESRRHPTRDEDIPWLVLFADVNPDDRRAVDIRRREWEALFR
jgi:hypothetical protein